MENTTRFHLQARQLEKLAKPLNELELICRKIDDAPFIFISVRQKKRLEHQLEIKWQVSALKTFCS